eukprot:10532741-Prorocentrum_lima.AAC.1
MTSSLVGSEMCIRDRPMWVISDESTRRPTPHVVEIQDCDDDKDNFDPVSYTHLTLPTICSV